MENKTFIFSMNFHKIVLTIISYLKFILQCYRMDIIKNIFATASLHSINHYILYCGMWHHFILYLFVMYDVLFVCASFIHVLHLKFRRAFRNKCDNKWIAVSFSLFYVMYSKLEQKLIVLFICLVQRDNLLFKGNILANMLLMKTYVLANQWICVLKYIYRVSIWENWNRLLKNARFYKGCKCVAFFCTHSPTL